MSAKIVYLRPFRFPQDDQPKGLGSEAIVSPVPGSDYDAIVCAPCASPNDFLCAFAENPQEQLALGARLARKRFKKSSRHTPPAA